MAWNVKIVCASMVAIVSKQFFKKYRKSCQKKNPFLASNLGEGKYEQAQRNRVS